MLVSTGVDAHTLARNQLRSSRSCAALEQELNAHKKAESENCMRSSANGVLVWVSIPAIA